MKILVIDTWGGDGVLDWIMRCQDEGHKVKWFFTRTDKNKDFGKGLAERIDDWKPWARWADLIFQTDNTKHVHGLEPFRKEGCPIVGANIEAAALELDRKLGQDTFKKNGIEVPPFREFKDYDQAIAYVSKSGGKRFVSKPCGDEGDKSLTYCAKSPADMVYMLQRWKKTGKLKASFLLQEFIGGTEMAAGAWFGPGGFNAGWHENFEFKKLMAGDTGPATGEMGTVLRVVRRSKLADKVLAPLEECLADRGYCGYVDVNCIIDEDGNPWPLEFTMRPGWPTFNIQQALHNGDHAEWLADLCAGNDKRNFSLNSVAVGVVMAIPDFPYSHITRKDVTGIPVYGLTPKLMQNVHPCGMMLGSAPQDVHGKVVEMSCLATAGDYVLVASGVGQSVQEARRGAYRVLKTLEAPASPFYRPDIGQRLKKQLPLIQAKGYATGLIF